MHGEEKEEQGKSNKTQDSIRYLLNVTRSTLSVRQRGPKTADLPIYMLYVLRNELSTTEIINLWGLLVALSTYIKSTELTHTQEYTILIWQKDLLEQKPIR